MSFSSRSGETLCFNESFAREMNKSNKPNDLHFNVIQFYSIFVFIYYSSFRWNLLIAVFTSLGSDFVEK